MSNDRSPLNAPLEISHVIPLNDLSKSQDVTGILQTQSIALKASSLFLLLMNEEKS